MTGPARYDDSGCFEAEPSSHPNFPNREQIDYESDGKVGFFAYDYMPLSASIPCFVYVYRPLTP